ncbi:hypothetical protein [Rugamonas sp.]|uniref:hypothetical protein n=1 Tax=Rugamonas sp. TaxID=1926287 RepID=UPI0025ED6708|nr:hypothetical protein [Rugamonas sp.]
MSKDSKTHRPPKQGASTAGGKQQADQSPKDLKAGNQSRSDQRNAQSGADSSAAATERNRAAGARGDANQHHTDNLQGNVKAHAAPKGDGASHGGKSR